MSAKRVRRPRSPRGHRYPQLYEFILVVAIAFAGAVLQARGCYERFEASEFDPAIASFLGQEVSGRDDAPTLVVISPSDYDTTFNAQSPLDPDRVLEIIDAVCKFTPRIVGIDVLTERWTAEQAARALEITEREVNGERCRLVWATGGRAESDELDSPIRLRNALGLSDSSSICSAPPLFFGDADGIIRRFQSEVPIITGGGVTFRPTLPAVLVDPDACLRAASATPALEHRRIRFRPRDSWIHLPASMVVKAAAKKPPPDLYNSVAPHLGKEHIVLIGGTYPEARDEYVTPLGVMHGVELIASAMTTFADPIRQPHPIVPWLLDVVIGCALLIGLHRFVASRKGAIVIAAVLAAAIAPVVSWLVFRHVGYAIGVFGSLVGVVVALFIDLILYETPELRDQNSPPRHRRLAG